VLAFAGLWDRWIDPNNFDEVISATIIVSGASAWVAPYHDRIPVVLEPQHFDGWLDGSLGAETLKPAAEEKLREHLVSPRLNRTGVGDDDPHHRANRPLADMIYMHLINAPEKPSNFNASLWCVIQAESR
jgi:putative SOS response-associated peptidase YedK